MSILYGAGQIQTKCLSSDPPSSVQIWLAVLKLMGINCRLAAGFTAYLGSHNLHREMEALNATWFLEIQSIKIPNVADFKFPARINNRLFLLRAGSREQYMKDRHLPA